LLLEVSALEHQPEKAPAMRHSRTSAGSYYSEIVRAATCARDPAASQLATYGTDTTTARLLKEAASINRLAEMAAPRLPRTATDHFKEFETSRRFDRPARTSGKRSAGAKPSSKAGQPADINEGAAKKPANRKATPSGSRPRKR
jgi:hypothetical protein